MTLRLTLRLFFCKFQPIFTLVDAKLHEFVSLLLRVVLTNCVNQLLILATTCRSESEHVRSPTRVVCDMQNKNAQYYNYSTAQIQCQIKELLGTGTV